MLFILSIFFSSDPLLIIVLSHGLLCFLSNINCHWKLHITNFYVYFFIVLTLSYAPILDILFFDSLELSRIKVDSYFLYIVHYSYLVICPLWPLNVSSDLMLHFIYPINELIYSINSLLYYVIYYNVLCN